MNFPMKVSPCELISDSPQRVTSGLSCLSCQSYFTWKWKGLGIQHIASSENTGPCIM